MNTLFLFIGVATTFQGVATSQDVLISLYTKSTFLSNQPEGWIQDRDTGKLRCFNDAVNVFVHGGEKRILGETNVVQVLFYYTFMKSHLIFLYLFFIFCISKFLSKMIFKEKNLVFIVLATVIPLIRKFLN